MTDSTTESIASGSISPPTELVQQLLSPSIEAATPSEGFEGPEKKLEVDFRWLATPQPSQQDSGNQGRTGFRSFERHVWDNVLELAQCSILSVKSNDHFDAYLLSESSLFVHPQKLMIKTCGTTTLLRALPKFLEMAKEVGLEFDFLQYSRATFKYPKQQLYPHNSFETEVEYLNKWFDGQSYILGTNEADKNCTQWHLYIADDTKLVTTEQSFEVFMFDLHPDAMSNFFFDQAKDQTGHAYATEVTTKQSGISQLVEEGTIIDAYNFSPCGYSMNALYKDTYYTIHITPESHCSYASFECNLPASDFSDLLAKVVDVFRPCSLSVAYIADEGAPASDSAVRLEAPKGFTSVGHKTFIKMITGQDDHEHEYSACLSTFQKTRDNSASSPVSLLSGHRVLLSDEETEPELESSPSLIKKKSSMLKYLPEPQHSALEKIYSVCDATKITNRDLPRLAMKLRKTAKVSTDPVVVVDLGKILTQFQTVLTEVSKAHNDFALLHAVSMGDDKMVLACLAELGSLFTVASNEELALLTEASVPEDSIVFNGLLREAPDLNDLSLILQSVAGISIPDTSSLALVEEVATANPKVEVIVNVTFDPDFNLEDSSKIVDRVNQLLSGIVANGLCPSGLSFDIKGCQSPSTDLFRKILYVLHQIAVSIHKLHSNLKTSDITAVSISSIFPGSSTTSSTKYLEALASCTKTIDGFFPPEAGYSVVIDASRFILANTQVFSANVVARHDFRHRSELSHSHEKSDIAQHYYIDRIPFKGESAVIEFTTNDGLDSPAMEKCIVYNCDDMKQAWSCELPALNVNDHILLWSGYDEQVVYVQDPAVLSKCYVVSA